MKDILDDVNLLKKYDVYAFDYIEYPHKSAWSTDYTDADARRDMLETFRKNPDLPLLFYIHIPFCEQLCWFCICHREIGAKYDRVKAYLRDSLFKEFEIWRRFFEENGIRPNFREIYMGGGSPTALREPEFDAMLDAIAPFVDVKNLDQFSIEIDPRRADVDRLRFYHSRGINKMSFGIQDFDPDVQQAVNRVQPPEMIEALLTDEIRGYFPSINFDLLVGLPMQTVDTIRATMERVVAMAPDRISLAYVHYGPKFHPHQVNMNRKALLPDFFERKRLFMAAVDVLAKTDYVRTGFEHFAKPRDRVAQAHQEGRAYYNSLGATDGDCPTIIATGRASYSTIGEASYFQYVYEQERYDEILREGRLPVLRGHRMTRSDLMRRDLIKTLRTYFHLDIARFEATWSVDFRATFARELDVLGEFHADGLVEIGADAIRVTEIGKHFANLIGSVFDEYVTLPRFNASVRTRAAAAR
ncbi:MAG: coproporphyrinogen dehydrogenase [Alphaproteobacteria bacterium]|nr:coproporphyrinogen dehydrogenase [Alphaproteobacteria bacterium]